ncbi:MAG: hypothetical protein KAX40_02680 [Herpetosiphon sp.]|nr:hypothetical protein [Herpetosiphon sp.]
MTKPVDQRNVLDDEIFDYRVTKNGTVMITWHGKTVKTLSGQKADDFLEKIADLEGKDAQLVMAKITGNFKRGNERTAKSKRQR